MKTNTKLLMSLSILAATLPSFAQISYPYFTIQPTNQTANQGFGAGFRSVAYTTNPPVSYQWYFNSNAIPWALTNTLTITNVSPGDAGKYFAVASDGIGFTTSRVVTLTVILPAVLDPKLSANIRVGEDPAGLPDDRRGQTETHLARSYSDPNLLLATCMEGTDGQGAMDCGYSVSTNGGLTWGSRTLVPGLTALSGGTLPLVADPAAAFDLAGNAFLINLPFNQSATYDELDFSKSSDQGQSFLPPQQLFRTNATYSADKDWIAINTFRDSTTVNRIAVAFTRQGGTNQIHCLYSDDGGSTWSPLHALGSTNTTYALPYFLPDGSLAVLYRRDLHGYLTHFDLLESVVSQDGGASFGPPRQVLDLRGLTPDSPSQYEDPVAFAYSAPTACVDHQAGVIYAAVHAWYGPATNRAPRVLFTKSIDRGLTWSQAVPVNDTPARKGVFLPVIAASPDGQHVLITFYDKRNDTGQGNFVDLYLAESFDGGDTWEANLRLTEFSSDLRNAPLNGPDRWLGDYFGLVPALNFDSPAVALWIDDRSGNNDPYAIRINRTKGTTFDAWRKLRFSTNDLANPNISGENADPDGDGIPNLAEYAFGLEPTHADARPLKIAQNGTGSAATAIVSYDRLAVLSDIQFSWESSPDLREWTPASPTHETVGPRRDPWLQRVQASFSPTGQMQFFRLAIARVPPGP
jgi:hypothetical protein